jgi:outer membrane protein insertion porin family
MTTLTLGDIATRIGHELRGDPAQPIGGAFKTVASAEIIFPTPFVNEDDDSTRLSWFFDIGNVFQNYDAWDAGELRASTGLSFQWRAPVGPIVINLAKPLRTKKGDDTEVIQFSFGHTF